MCGRGMGRCGSWVLRLSARRGRLVVEPWVARQKSISGVFVSKGDEKGVGGC